MKFIVLFFTLFSSVIWANEQDAELTSSQVNEPQLTFTQLSDNVYQHISYKNVAPWGMVAASGLVVVEGNNAYLIDTPWSSEDTEKLIAWVASKKLVLKAAIATHFHQDASGGIALLNRLKIKTYALSLTNKLLNMNHQAQASNEITTDLYQLVSDIVEVFYPGAGHSPDNVVVWLPQSKILFGGCFVKNLKSKNLGNVADASIEFWPKAMQKVIDQFPDIAVVVPGHGKVGDITLLKHTAQLALDKMNNN